MPTATVPSPSVVHHYPAQQSLPHINFSIEAPDAESVFLCGDFNDWDPNAYPMQRMPNGVWKLQLDLPSGEHHYWFLVDGKPRLDPKAERISNELLKHKVSLLMVA